MGKFGGGGGGQPQTSTQTSQPHPFAFKAVQDYLAAAQELAGRSFNPYPESRVAGLDPLHETALGYGQDLFMKDLPMAQNILGQFAGGNHVAPAYIHPFLAGAPGTAGANSYFSPQPWGLTPFGGLAAPPSAPAAGASRASPALPSPPAALSRVAGRGASGPTAGVGPGGLFDTRFYGSGGIPPGEALSLSRQNQMLGLNYGTPLSQPGGQVTLNPGGSGAITFATDKPLTKDAYNKYMMLEERMNNRGGN